MIRISKLLSERGICSRREADRYIEQGLVLVEGKVVSELGTRCAEDAHIELAREARRRQQAKVTILLHKPVGYVSNMPEKGYPEASELLTPDNQFNWEDFSPSNLRKLAVAGRLDIDSKGLLVFTQDGALVKRLIGPDCLMEKEYLVRVEGEITREKLGQLRFGLTLDEKALKRADVSIVEKGLLKIVLREGKKRQIRRMCELVELKVTSLKRVRIGRMRLGDLPMGKWRYLQPGETF